MCRYYGRNKKMVVNATSIKMHLINYKCFSKSLDRIATGHRHQKRHKVLGWDLDLVYDVFLFYESWGPLTKNSKRLIWLDSFFVSLHCLMVLLFSLPKFSKFWVAVSSRIFLGIDCHWFVLFKISECYFNHLGFSNCPLQAAPYTGDGELVLQFCNQAISNMGAYSPTLAWSKSKWLLGFWACTEVYFVHILPTKDFQNCQTNSPLATQKAPTKMPS